MSPCLDFPNRQGTIWFSSLPLKTCLQRQLLAKSGEPHVSRVDGTVVFYLTSIGCYSAVFSKEAYSC